jgi:predicted dehydrogenase
MTIALDRRDFFKTAAGTLALLLSERGLTAAQTPSQDAPAGPPVVFGVVGLGAWGRDILATLGRMSTARVAMICDTYEPFLKRSGSAAPAAASVTDFRRILESSEVDAVIIATPTPTHKDIVLASLEAGKHVYCEAPLAATIEDARAVADAASRRPKQVFQAGLQGRANSLYRHVSQFVKSGVLDDVAFVNAQWNKKESWRRVGPTPERERELNWRLLEGSPGLMGEVAIHQIDLVAQYLGAYPSAITGFGSLVAWKDGRAVPDTVLCLIDVGDVGRTRVAYRATLASSFGGAYTVFQGSNSSLLIKENQSWLVKESDSALLGWEVYARKETVHDETGIAMVADATKLLQAGKEPGKDGSAGPEKPALLLAFESFVESVREGRPSVCGAREGFRATVAALKANQAVVTGGRVDVTPAEYELV